MSVRVIMVVEHQEKLLTHSRVLRDLLIAIYIVNLGVFLGTYNIGHSNVHNYIISDDIFLVKNKSK